MMSATWPRTPLFFEVCCVLRREDRLLRGMELAESGGSVGYVVGGASATPLDEAGDCIRQYSRQVVAFLLVLRLGTLVYLLGCQYV